MAHLNWHGKIIASYHKIGTDNRYHVTETNWIIATYGPRGGNAKIKCRPSETAKFQKYTESFKRLVTTNKFHANYPCCQIGVK